MRRSSADRLLRILLRGVSVTSIALVLLILLHLLSAALPGLRSIGPWKFLTDVGWYPTDPAEPAFGLSAMFVASLAVSLGALLVALPLGVLSAVFCHYYLPQPLRRSYRRLLELMAGIPSVVYGFWGLVSLVPWIQRVQPPGASLLAGVLVLTLMIVPTIALLAEAALRAVPLAHREAAAALHLSAWTTFRCVALPSCRAAFGVAGILGGLRAIGETMAVVMVCGNVVQMPTSVFSSVRTLTANIALELGYASSEHRSALFVSGLLLMALVLLLTLARELLSKEAVRA